MPNSLQRLVKSFTQDRNLRHTLINSGWLLSSNFVVSILQFIQSLIITRTLGAEKYGFLVVVTTFVTLVQQIIDSRLWEAVIKYFPLYMESGNKNRTLALLKLFYLIDSIAAVITWSLLILTAETASRVFLKDPKAAIFIQLYAWFVIIDFSTETSSALLRVNDRFKWLSYQNMIQVVIKIVGTLIVWVLGPTVENMLGMMLITSLIGVVILQIMTLKVLRTLKLTDWRNSPLRLLKGDFRQIFAFIFYSNLSATSRLVTSKVDVLILGWLATPLIIGLYDLAKRLVNQVQTLITPIYTAVYPDISQLVAKRQFQELWAMQSKLSQLILGAVIALCMGFSIAVIWVIPFFFGSDFAPAVPYAQIMIWSLIWTPLVWFPGFMLALGLARSQALFVWFDAVVYVVLLVIGVQWAGGMGAAVATLLRFVIWTVVALLIISRVYRTHLSLQTTPVSG